MSSTNRGGIREVSDFYVTPVPIILDFLNQFDKEIKIFKFNIKILGPCAGGDLDNKMSYPDALEKFGCPSKIDTLDIREDSQASNKGDFLSYEFEEKYDVIITNPPFSLALDIIYKALNNTNENGYVIMLLRLNFFESKKRFEFYKRLMPSYCFVHHERISFTPDGKTDSICYAHFVWQKGNNPKFCKLKVI